MNIDKFILHCFQITTLKGNIYKKRDNIIDYFTLINKNRTQTLYNECSSFLKNIFGKPNAYLKLKVYFIIDCENKKENFKATYDRNIKEKLVLMFFFWAIERMYKIRGDTNVFSFSDFKKIFNKMVLNSDRDFSKEFFESEMVNASYKIEKKCETRNINRLNKKKEELKKLFEDRNKEIIKEINELQGDYKSYLSSIVNATFMTKDDICNIKEILKANEDNFNANVNVKTIDKATTKIMSLVG